MPVKELRFSAQTTGIGMVVFDRDPINWASVNRNWKRSEEYDGVTYEFTDQWDVVGSGYDHIKAAYDADGVRADTILEVEELDPSDLSYKVVYRGRINYTTISFSTIEGKRPQVGFNVEEDNFDRTVLSYLGNKFPLDKLEDVNGNPIAPYTNGDAVDPVVQTPVPDFFKAELHSTTVRQIHLTIQEPIDEITAIPDLDSPHDPTQVATFFIVPFGGNETQLDEVSDVVTNTLINWHDNTGLNDQPSNRNLWLLKAEFAGTYEIDLGELDIRTFIASTGSDTLRTNFITDTFMEAVFEIREARAAPTDPPAPIKQKIVTLVDSDVNNDALAKFLFTKSFRFDDNFISPFPIELEAEEEVYCYFQIRANVFQQGITGPFGFNTTSEQNFAGSTTPPTELRTFVRGLTVFEQTDCAGQFAFETLQRLLNITTGLNDRLRSDFFIRENSQPRSGPLKVQPDNTFPGWAFFTNGYQIREFPLLDILDSAGNVEVEKQPPVISFRQAFDALNKIFNLGFGFFDDNGDRVVRVEEKKYFYPDRIVAQLGSPRSIVITPATDRYYNSVESGYNTWKVDDPALRVSSLDEFNSPKEYTIPNQYSDNKLDLRPDVQTGGYSIEFKRRDPFNQATSQDVKKDDDFFLIDVLQFGGNFGPYRSRKGQDGFFPVDNVIDPANAYNIAYSPALQIKRWLNVISASFYKFTSELLRFGSGEGNVNMSNKFSSEGTDIDVSGANPLYIPEYYEFEYPLRPNQIKAITADPYGYISFNDEQGALRTGWIVELSVNFKTRLGTFKLIRRS